MFRRNAAVFLEIPYHVAAIGKTGFLTDVVEVEIGEEQVILHLENADFDNVFFAGYTVNHVEFLGKAGIAHIAFLRNIADLNGIADMCFDVLGDGVDVVRGARLKYLVADGEIQTLPLADDLHEQVVQVGLNHQVIAIGFVRCLLHAIEKCRLAVHARRNGTVKENGHFLLLCIFEQFLELGGIGRLEIELVEVEFQHGIAQRCTIRRENGVNGLWMEDDTVAAADNVPVAAVEHFRCSLQHVNHLHEVMPMGADGEHLAACVKDKTFKRAVERIARFK